MNLQELIEYGILDELANVFHTRTNAGILLTSIAYPNRELPPLGVENNPLEFWQDVCTRINTGILSSGNDLQVLVNAAARRFQTNPIFSQYSTHNSSASQSDEQAIQRSITQQTEPTSRGNSFVYILVEGWDDFQQLIDRARELATAQGRDPDSIQLAFQNIEGILLNLENWTMEQASLLARELRDELSTNNRQVQTSTAQSDFRDYLISQLYVEGPDQVRFEINDIRASTPVREVAQGVIAEGYTQKAFPGGERKTVVDLVDRNGVSRRLAPGKSLHESGIQGGETLQVSPESTAGVHPQVREEALARACNQVLAYANSHPGFGVSANARRTPTEYEFTFQATSFAPPTQPLGSPIEINDHRVFLLLPPGFPMQAPIAFWQTPIFHPNVHQTNGKVCLGALEEHYRPNLDFGDLCQLLIDIARYQNYTLEEGYNRAARDWALTKEGQMAIQRRGGQSFYRDFVRRKFQELQEKGINFDQLQEIINPLCEVLKDIGAEDLTPEQLRQELKSRPLTIKRVHEV